MVRVAVAGIAMEYGTPINEQNVRLVPWPEDSVPQGAFDSTKDLINTVEPRVVLRPIAVGEPILASKITGVGGRATISAILKKGMRAVAVRTSDVSGVAGFVVPGDSVDVLITRTPPAEGSGRDQQITDILLQNVRVIAVDQNASDGKSDPVVVKTATLEVDQIGAQKLALAQQVGSLSLALRNPAFQEPQPVMTVSTEDLRDGIFAGSYNSQSGGFSAGAGDDFVSAPVYRPRRVVRRSPPRAAAPAPPPPPKPITVEIVRGTGSTNYEVKRDVR